LFLLTLEEAIGFILALFFLSIWELGSSSSK
jgi:hypothetical protein